MKKITEGTAIMQNYALYELSGTVQSENTRSETSVSGSVTGGYGNQGVRGSVSSNTIRYQTIYLKGDDGTEHAAELVDLIIPCREGHKLTLWGINQGSWFEGINHTTKQASKSKKTLTKFTMPVKAILWGAILVGVFSWMVIAYNIEVKELRLIVGCLGGLLSFGFAYLLFLIPGKIVSVMRSKQISADKESHASTAKL